MQIILELGVVEARLIISDNGKGFNSSSKEGNRGIGLLSMEERMKAIGGTVRIDSGIGKGILVEARCSRLGVVENVLDPNIDRDEKQANKVKVKKVENLRL